MSVRLMLPQPAGVVDLVQDRAGAQRTPQGGSMSSSVHKVAVVTGAGSGIGAAVAHALAAEGRVVVLACHRRDALASVAEPGAGLAGVLDPVPADVTDEASVRACSTGRWQGTAGSTFCSTTPAPGAGPRPGRGPPGGVDSGTPWWPST
jgi:short chain dehydrogenase